VKEYKAIYRGRHKVMDKPWVIR